jgi:hypothetical protein
MTVEQSATTEITDDSANNNQAEKTFTQAELNAILAKTKTQYERKFASKYEDLGDPEELRGIVSNYRQQQQELEIKKGNFDKIMADFASKKDAEIAKRDNIIREFKVEQPLLNLAAKYRSVNPEQVAMLLKGGLRLNEEGEVEVIDTKTGQTRYNSKGKPVDVETYVKEFLDNSPHFVAAGAATTNTQGNVNKNANQTIDLANLDMTRADHREIYKQAKAKGLV